MSGAATVRAAEACASIVMKGGQVAGQRLVSEERECKWDLFLTPLTGPPPPNTPIIWAERSNSSIFGKI
eukprot:scaffold20982_cov70-Cyclotella_meneghiniana.AAC.2